MGELTDRSCVPCQRGVPALEAGAIDALARELSPGWVVVDGHHLEKSYEFNGFRDALDYVVRVGELAEAEGHHPDIYLAWGKVTLTIWTHKVDGLTESDFILAAKADQRL